MESNAGSNGNNFRKSESNAEDKKKALISLSLYGVWTILLIGTMLFKKLSPLYLLFGLEGHLAVVLATDEYVHSMLSEWQSNFILICMFLFIIFACFLHPDMVRGYHLFYLLTLCRVQFVLGGKSWIKKKKDSDETDGEGK